VADRITCNEDVAGSTPVTGSTVNCASDLHRSASGRPLPQSAKRANFSHGVSLLAKIAATTIGLWILFSASEAGPLAPLVAASSGADHAGVVSASENQARVRALTLTAEHDCWTGSAPAGVEAGHAVVTRRGSTAPSYVASGPALEQLFGGVDHGLTVHAFCR